MDISNVRRHLPEGFLPVQSDSLLFQHHYRISRAALHPTSAGRPRGLVTGGYEPATDSTLFGSACCIMQLHQYYEKGTPILLNRHGLFGCLQDMGGQIDATPLQMETDQHVLHEQHKATPFNPPSTAQLGRTLYTGLEVVAWSRRRACIISTGICSQWRFLKSNLLSNHLTLTCLP